MTSRLRGVGAVVAYLPYEFGFTPRDSVVLIGLHEGNLRLTARIDAPPPEQTAAAAVQLLAPVGRTPIDDALLVLYDDAARTGERFAVAVRRRLQRSHVPVSHVIQVEDGQWRATRCGCGHCPRHWRAIPEDSSVGPIADRVLRGVAPVADRATLAAELGQRQPQVAAAVAAQLGRMSRDKMRVLPGTAIATDALAGVLAEVRTPVAALPVATLAAATDVVGDVGVRDAIIAWLMPEFMDPQLLPLWPALQARLGPPPTQLTDEIFGDRAMAVAARLKEWVQCLSPERSVPVLLFVAALHWTMGDGAVASMAVERALRVDPHCRLAQLYDAALQHGLRPRWREDRRPA